MSITTISDRQPLFSVIVPVYKAETTLQRCAESILTQTLEDFELILIDDGSPDQSGAICDEYASADRRVRVIHKPNGGVSSARNAGIDIAHGRWIVFIDSDDWVEPNHLEDLALEPQTDLRLCGRKKFTNEGIEVYSAENEIFKTKSHLIEGLNKYFYDYFISPWAKRFTNLIIQTHKIRFHEAISYAEDRIFMTDYLYWLNSFSMSSLISYNYDFRKTDSLSKKSTSFDDAYTLVHIGGLSINQLYHAYGEEIYPSLQQTIMDYFERALQPVLNEEMAFSTQRMYLKKLWGCHIGELLKYNIINRRVGKGKSIVNLLARIRAYTVLTLVLRITKGY